MNIVLQLILITVGLEFLLIIPQLWRLRLPVLVISSGFNVASALYILLFTNSIWLSIGSFVILFRIVNNVRIIAARKHKKYLYRAGAQTIFVLGLIQLMVLLFHHELSEPSVVMAIEYLSALQLAGAMLLVAWITNSLFQMTYHENGSHLTDKELPTVTVAIPARNETRELSACIDSILSSNYPKLEVLVLDDCSQDATPHIIKQYAHAGVRFLEGAPEKEGWLAKNHAYAQLANEASGSIIVFCGVDVRMSPDFLRKLVTYARTRKKRMVSVLPLRLGGSALSSFVQPMRYWWEVALPRKFLNRPAVLSTCWLIDSKVLKSLGSFEAVKQNILPERYFARECVAHDSYSFLRANELFDLRTAKQPYSQTLTTLRVRYPQLKNQPENVLAMTSAVYVFALLPFVFFTIALAFSIDELIVLTGATIFLLILGHVSILRVTNPSNSVLGIVNFPVVVLTDMFLTLYSMVKYEFGRVYWKGRNVCMPVAHKKPQRASHNRRRRRHRRH